MHASSSCADHHYFDLLNITWLFVQNSSVPKWTLLLIFYIIPFRKIYGDLMTLGMFVSIIMLSHENTVTLNNKGF